MAQTPSQSEPPALRPSGSALKGAGDQRRRTRDERARPETSGDAGGTARGRRHLRLGWAVIIAVAGAVCLLNVLGYTRDGRAPVVDHLVYEGSSWIAISLLAWAPFLVWRWGARRPWPLALVAHALAALAFAVAHIGLFILLRAAAFSALGKPYDLTAAIAQFRHEVWKDLLAYGLLVGAYALIGYLDRDRRAPAAEMFDIRDGARLVRTRLDEIVAISAAGNYAEFHLRDGRRPLMRSSLSALEAELDARGFVRTHRSWLVNGQAVTAL
ncbi:MAG: LytTR family DNA-binding domain-containing protein, partial [Caulobacteraceae bacterium]|nr:LytTR family DNA-binding domain-containing protein [Caulobacteraceae bacterium]